jgi:monovalent cation:H+ antiporter-2, CPA2 family
MALVNQHSSITSMSARHVIVIGFGLSGRAVANAAEDANVSVSVIEMNMDTVTRCTRAGLNIIHGDARDPDILRHAGIDVATHIAVTVPNDEMALAVVERARVMAPNARIVARCTFVSGGMEATQRGADEVVIAEQVVAKEFGQVMSAAIR